MKQVYYKYDGTWYVANKDIDIDEKGELSDESHTYHCTESFMLIISEVAMLTGLDESLLNNYANGTKLTYYLTLLYKGTVIR